MHIKEKMPTLLSAIFLFRGRITSAILRLLEVHETAAYLGVCEDFEGEYDAKITLLDDFAALLHHSAHTTLRHRRHSRCRLLLLGQHTLCGEEH